MKNNLILTAALAAALFAGSAQAGLTGDSVTTRLTYGAAPDESLEVVAVVGAGSEGDFFSSQIFDYADLAFNLRSTQAFIQLDGQSAQITLRLSDLDFGAGQVLTGVNTTSLLSGVSTTFGADFVEFKWIDQSIPGETYLSAQFVTGVPEPETYAMLLAGLGLIGLAASRRK